MQTPRNPWWPYPALRQVLEAKPPAPPEDGWTSVSDNIYEQLQRLVKVADQAELYRNDLLQAMREKPELSTQVLDELGRLRGALEAMSHAFDHQIDALGRLRSEIYVRFEEGRGQ